MPRLDPAVAAVRHAVRHHLADLEPGAQVLVACSGGPDSLSLAAGTWFEGERAGWQVGAVVVDHGMQPGSDRVTAEVAGRLQALGCDPVEAVRVPVADQGSPEAAARAARYRALEDAAAARDAVVVLGHTLDDQAESVLLGLVRGSGTRSLSGMAPVVGRFRRPLLDLTREQTEQACRALGLTTWKDPMNADERYTRVRVRRRVLPVLEQQLGPGVARALARTAGLARADADALDALAATLAGTARRSESEWDVATLRDALPAVRRRVLRRAAVAAGAPEGELFAVHVKEMERLLTHWHGQAGVDLPGHLRATRDSDRLVLWHAGAARTPRG